LGFLKAAESGLLGAKRIASYVCTKTLLRSG
jgi:hypothetical protein